VPVGSADKCTNKASNGRKGDSDGGQSLAPTVLQQCDRDNAGDDEEELTEGTAADAPAVQVRD
jgi:hypothetical protein